MTLLCKIHFFFYFFMEKNLNLSSSVFSWFITCLFFKHNSGKINLFIVKLKNVTKVCVTDASVVNHWQLVYDCMFHL